MKRSERSRAAVKASAARWPTPGSSERRHRLARRGGNRPWRRRGYLRPQVLLGSLGLGSLGLGSLGHLFLARLDAPAASRAERKRHTSVVTTVTPEITRHSPRNGF